MDVWPRLSKILPELHNARWALQGSLLHEDRVPGLLDGSPPLSHPKGFEISNDFLLQVSAGDPAAVNLCLLKAKPLLDQGDLAVLVLPSFSWD